MRRLKRFAKLFLRSVSTEWVTADRIARDLQTLGVRRGEVLLVHSSLSSLGFVPGGARTVINALLATVGPAGTLVMPSHSWDRYEGGDFRFDVKHTPSCVGVISETFRTMPGVMRSLHPTHSIAALGPKAPNLTEGHESALTPCGEGTPYAKLLDERCQILFLGATLDQNTIFHTFESLVGAPYLMRDEPELFTVTDTSGTTRPMRFRRHNRGPARRFAVHQPILAARGVLHAGKVAASESLLVEGAPMAEVMLSVLQAHPNFLLE